MDMERWQQLSLAQQLGQVGSEISRGRHWENKKDLASRQKALARALDLLSLTLDDPRWVTRRRELARFQEVLASWYAQKETYQVLPDALEQYCTALVVRSARNI